MDLENLEKHEAFYIDADWYKNRKKGISAMLRVRNEEEFIKPCLLSIAGFFDEIVVALNNCTDATPGIIEGLHLPNVTVCHYPFALHHNGPGHDAIPQHSVHDNAYFYNWVLSKTTFLHVCKWDGDMVALPALNKKLKRFMLNHTVTSITGINISGEALVHKSKDAPTNTEPRIFRVSENTYYHQGALAEYFTHDYTSKIGAIDEPLFLHFKQVKSLTSATQIWPENWREVALFQNLYRRRETGDLYAGSYPEALKEKMVTRAITCAREVTELNNRERVMQSIGDLLFGLRKRGVQGSLVEIGPLKGETTVFLSRMAETLFPGHILTTVVSPRAAVLNRLSQLQNVSESYGCFTRVTGGLENHLHLHMTSQEAEEKLPRDIIFAFLNGEDTFAGVVGDFKRLYDRTLKNGIIALNNYNNPACPEVVKAFEAIRKHYRFRVRLMQSDSAAACFVKRR